MFLGLLKYGEISMIFQRVRSHSSKKGDFLTKISAVVSCMMEEARREMQEARSKTGDVGPGLVVTKGFKDERILGILPSDKIHLILSL